MTENQSRYISDLVPKIEGWCTEEKAKILFDLVLSSNSQITVELGVFAGRSLLPMAVAHKDKGSGIAIGIDAWKKDVCLEGTNSPLNDDYWSRVDFSKTYLECQRLIVQHKLFDYCATLKIKSQQAACLFEENSIDIIHQDSGHNVETITEELKLWSPLLKMGGHWIADDCDWVEAKDGYSHLPEYGFLLVNDFTKWQIWQKIK